MVSKINPTIFNGNSVKTSDMIVKADIQIADMTVKDVRFALSHDGKKYTIRNLDDCSFFFPSRSTINKIKLLFKSRTLNIIFFGTMEEGDTLKISAGTILVEVDSETINFVNILQNDFNLKLTINQQNPPEAPLFEI